MNFGPEHQLQAVCVDFVRLMCPGVKVVASMNGMYLGPRQHKVKGKLPPGNQYLFPQKDIPKKAPTNKGIAAYIAKMKRLGMVPGDTDLRLHWKEITGCDIITDGGSYFRPMGEFPRSGFCELKIPGKTPTPEQWDEINWYKANGFYAGWSNTFDNFVGLLKSWGVPMRSGSFVDQHGVTWKIGGRDG